MLMILASFVFILACGEAMLKTMNHDDILESTCLMNPEEPDNYESNAKFLEEVTESESWDTRILQDADIIKGNIHEYILSRRIKVSTTYPALGYPNWQISDSSFSYQLVVSSELEISEDYYAIGNLGDFSIVKSNLEDKYVIKNKFAKGNFGEVWFAKGRLLNGIALNLNYEQDFVLKRIFCNKSVNLLESGEREVYFGKKFENNPHVARFVEYFYQNDELWLVFRNEGRSLDNLLYESIPSEDNVVLVPSQLWYDFRNTFVGQKTRVEIMKQILIALDSFQKNYVVHRDIKPSNILVNRINTHIFIRIADFGSAYDYHQVDLYQKTKPNFQQETQQYQPPEARLSDGVFPYLNSYTDTVGEDSVSYSYDIWSCGILFLELYLGRSNFFEASPIVRRRVQKNIKLQSRQTNFIPNDKFWDQAFFIGALQEFGIHPENMNITKFNETVEEMDSLGEGLLEDELVIIFSMLQWDPHRRPSAEALLKRLSILEDEFS